jgi:acyl-CoA thioesterase-1
MAMGKSWGAGLCCAPAFALALIVLALTMVSGAAQAQIVAFGASNVSGWNVAATDAFPAQLQAMLRAQGYQVRVRNAGIYGNTTADMRKRMETDIPPGTTIVLLDTSGDLYNDATKGISRAQGEADLDAIVARLTQRGIKIIRVDFADLPPEDRQKDGKHLTPEGHKRVAAQLLPQVIDAFGPPAATSSAVTQACRADAVRLCADVLHDEAKRRACMHDHRADLSKDCLAAIAKSRQGG